MNTLKHYDNGNGYELCSGRVGWSRRKTTVLAEVTCKNCLKQLSKRTSAQAGMLVDQASEGEQVRP